MINYIFLQYFRQPNLWRFMYLVAHVHLDLSPLEGAGGRGGEGSDGGLKYAMYLERDNKKWMILKILSRLERAWSTALFSKINQSLRGRDSWQHNRYRTYSENGKDNEAEHL